MPSIRDTRPGATLVLKSGAVRAAALAEAAKRGTVLPLFIIEPDLWRQADYAGRHWAFAAESLVELRAQLLPGSVPEAETETSQD